MDRVRFGLDDVRQRIEDWRRQRRENPEIIERIGIEYSHDVRTPAISLHRLRERVETEHEGLESRIKDTVRAVADILSSTRDMLLSVAQDTDNPAAISTYHGGMVALAACMPLSGIDTTLSMEMRTRLQRADAAAARMIYAANAYYGPRFEQDVYLLRQEVRAFCILNAETLIAFGVWSNLDMKDVQV